jgi:uncharacterized SAM-binding protein YcdF (DUF218 family)
LEFLNHFMSDDCDCSPDCAMIASIARSLLLPPASFFFLLLLGLLLGRRYRRAGRAICIAAIMLLFVSSTGIGAMALVYPLERMTRALQAQDAATAQAIVVLAAGRHAKAPEYGGADIPDYVALARLRYAAHLHRQTGLPLLVSGGNGSPDGEVPPKALAMAAALRHDFAIPVRWVETASATTAGNAYFSARMLRQDQVHRVLLVTDAMHMPRSVMAFAANGMDVIAAPTVFFSSGSLGLPDLLPSAEQLRRSHYATYEWIGLAWYAVRYAGAGEAVVASPP